MLIKGMILKMSKDFIVETSARHLHVTKEDLKTLFGEDAKLTNRKDLSQPGQFASDQRVTIVGPKNELKNVSILGPERNATQVEISRTDSFSVGIPAPIRESGDVKGSEGCTIIGPAGKVELKEGVIIAKRHIHMTPKDAENFNVKDGQIVAVKVSTEERSTIYDDVVIRVSPSYALAMHIDTDESNAANCKGEIRGEIVNLS